jgi:hypothetical protein
MSEVNPTIFTKILSMSNKIQLFSEISTYADIFFVDGTILHTEDLCEEETEKFNIKPMYESLSSISSSNSTLDSNNLDNTSIILPPS